MQIHGGLDGFACKAKLALIIKQYKEDLKSHQAQTGITDNNNGLMNEMHPRDKLIADIIEMQETIKSKKEAKTKEEIEAASLQQSSRESATNRISDKMQSSSSEPLIRKKSKFNLHTWSQKLCAAQAEALIC